MFRLVSATFRLASTAVQTALLLAMLAVLAVILIACTGAGTGPHGSTRKDDPTPKPCVVTMDKYDALRTGMSYQEAVEVLGCRGEENARTELGGSTTVIYSWANPGGANMNATFQDNALVAKAQFGLK